MPFGMVKLGPDLHTGRDSYSGYQANGVFIGFSMLHESGTGGAPKYGVVSQMPILGDITNPLADHTETRASPDEAKLGYYKATLGSGTTVELGATERAGLYKYNFPASNERRNIIVDVSHVLPSFRGMGLGQTYLGGSIKINVQDGGRLQYQGSGSYDMVRLTLPRSYIAERCRCDTNSSAGLESRRKMDRVLLRLV